MSGKIEVTRLGRSGFVEKCGLASPTRSEAAQSVKAAIKEHRLEAVRVVVGDQHGQVRGKTLTTDDFLESLHNGCAITTAILAMDSGNNIAMPVFSEDGGFGIKEMGGAGDLLMVPDPATFRVLPWAPKTGWVLADLYLKSGVPCPFDTRHVLRTALARLRETGYDFVAGLEVEFYIFRIEDPRLALEDSGRPPTPPRVMAPAHGYQYQSEIGQDALSPLLSELHENLVALGLKLRSMEDEYGPGQTEFTFDPGVGLDPADEMLLFRSATKQLCRRRGYLATFMCRPGLPHMFSSGWHLHLSLRETKTGKNAFVSPEGKAALSDVGLHFLGGLLHHARAATLFANPTINGYKRLNPNPLSPNRAVWSVDNKGAMVRVVGGWGEAGTHLENRLGEPSANPYLFMASQIITGLDGMVNRRDPGAPSTDPYAETDKEPLPRTLMEAMEATKASPLFRQTLGEPFLDWYLNLKENEVARFLSHVTDWEHREYFEMF